MQNTHDTYQNIKKYYINLDTRTDRRKNIETQIGQDFKRVSAVVGVNLTSDEINKTFDLETAKNKYDITLTNEQIACTLSHFKIYQEIANDETINDNSFVLISEDDNKFIDQFPLRINQLLAFLSQNKFKTVNMVLLRYHSFTQFVDFVPDDFKLDYNRLDHYKNEERKKHISKTNIYGNAKAHKKSQYFSFKYDNNIYINDNEKLFSRTQNLIALSSLVPFSSACYLIRKSAVKAIVNKFKKPFWITDDFKAIIPTYSILLTSPLLAVEQIDVSTSDIQNYKALENARNATIFTAYELQSAIRLEKFHCIYSLIYSKYAFNRSIGKLILKILKIY